MDTASGGALDQVVALLGVTRRSAQYATGEVLFTRAAGVRGDIDIKAGTQLSTATDPSLAFETTATKTLRDGQLSIKVPVRATLTGPQINAQPGELSIMARPIAGIQSVTNPEGTAQGQAGETDDELRERAKQMLAGSGNATLSAMQNALLGVPGVRSVSLQEDMDNQPGQVLLTVDCSEAAVGQVLVTLENTRAAGVRVVHNLIPPSGTGSGPTPGQVTLTTVDAEVRMALALADGNVTQETIARMLNNVRDGIVAYLDTLKVGQALAYGKLVSLAMAVDGVADVASLTIRRLDKTPPEDLAAGKNLEIEPGQKVKVAANALSVEVDGAPVNLDVVIALASGVFNEADLRSALQTLPGRQPGHRRAGSHVAGADHASADPEPALGDGRVQRHRRQRHAHHRRRHGNTWPRQPVPHRGQRTGGVKIGKLAHAKLGELAHAKLAGFRPCPSVFVKLNEEAVSKRDLILNRFPDFVEAQNPRKLLYQVVAALAQPLERIGPPARRNDVVPLGQSQPRRARPGTHRRAGRHPPFRRRAARAVSPPAQGAGGCDVFRRHNASGGASGGGGNSRPGYLGWRWPASAGSWPGARHHAGLGRRLPGAVAIGRNALEGWCVRSGAHRQWPAVAV